MNVLVIPEDFRKDQYVLKPIVQAVLASVGKPRANVRVMADPLLGGVAKALDLATLRDVVLPRYKGMVDLYLLLVDRDGNANRRGTLKHLEESLRRELGAGRCFLAENAHEELEVWALAGATLPADWKWAEVRSDIHPKERFFVPLTAKRGLQEEPGEGRDTLGREAAAQLPRLHKLCPELAHLTGRVQAFVASSSCEGEPFHG